ncbi:hypothetical protein [Henriciella marina]|uniref:hypothetical protein n=1 Tax=Henriciella marina TaxID=453851 RepID=UPI0012E9E7D8|nr:hypothetical protein [Henriciella marina]
MISIRTLRRGLLSSLGAILALSTPAGAQAQRDDNTPPTTLPFEPTVPSAPPGYEPQPSQPSTPRPSQPQRQQSPGSPPPPPPPPPGDPLCYEIGPYIREGASASRFAALSPSTASGNAIGSFEAGDALSALGAGQCVVVIPGAEPFGVEAPYNQVTCTLAIEQSDETGLDPFRARRDTLTQRIAECPAVAEWQAELVTTSGTREGSLTADQVFSHPDVNVEMVVRASQRMKSGQWPDNYIRTLALILRTPNPDRPPPPEPAQETETGSN